MSRGRRTHVNSPRILSESYIRVKSLIFKLWFLYNLRLIESLTSHEDIIIYRYFMLSIFYGDFGK
jgi:hypothetical protein